MLIRRLFIKSNIRFDNGITNGAAGNTNGIKNKIRIKCFWTLRRMVATTVSEDAAMVFHNFFGAGLSVQPIDVLCDDTDALTCSFQFSHFHMDNIGLILTSVKYRTIKVVELIRV